MSSARRVSMAHPRSRGENMSWMSDTLGAGGSSPLTRGKRHRRDAPSLVCWLIPAHAGKTQRRTRCSSTSRAHPRSRGENPGARPLRDQHGGSSPLTRGKRILARHAEGRVRLIPAHAGKTRDKKECQPADWAHPRSRGENSAPPTPAPSPVGSSPLTRGKPDAGHGLVVFHGLIPAHAGKTRWLAHALATSRAHPRSRGENVTWSSRSWASVGSSPLTRGKHP